VSASSHADPASRVTYLDSSAVVKLIVAEAESAGLLAFLQFRTKLVSSVLTEIEVTRAIRRAAQDEMALRRTRRILDGLWLINVSSGIRSGAAGIDPPGLRSLDAIHLATALSLGPGLDAFVVYDTALARAARALGLRVVSPR
jgi:predicted nucleic acid-binding protein